ncbi:hypothetical protein [Acetobacter sp. DsW_063]|uniref:hypothetical protein n=1 Tax=Acetobacter sp. DsW_063 TaxID=1514894 RepID=UPI001177F181|nr:hypothetical protein [Acetobacter sp. DsW_063]
MRYRALFPSLVRDARAAAAMIARNEPIFQTESAKANHGRLVSWAVDLGIETLIKSGRWPVDYRWKPFAKPTGKYLEVRLSHSVMSVSQVTDPTIQPRDVVFRQNARLNNQPTFGFAEFDDTRSTIGLPSFLLIHGRIVRGEEDHEFVHIGVPNHIHSRNYIYKTPNLMQMVHDISSDLPPVEDTETEAVLSLKDDIEKWRRDNGYE